ncbi:MAG: prepilin-type N-terminal cleavage/methylation domain-containing protein [Solirubrobacteraceae bacterium]|jgi:prepilin-type N-terminal cleavage/methylation domain-containing protein
MSGHLDRLARRLDLRSESGFSGHLDRLARRLDLRSESGFTLIELMVATVIGIIVSAATLAIVIVSVDFSSNLGDRVNATQQGTVAMEKITQALNSSCVSSSLSPILATSDANDVWFYSLLGDNPTIQPNEVEIQLSGGSLLMNTYAWVSGTAPGSWTFSSTPSSFVLLQNAAQAGSTPVFQYYGYGSNGVLSAVPYTLSPTLGASNATSTAEIAINFQANPSDNWTALGRPSDFSDAVVLRLSPASSSTADMPCS